MTKLFDSVCVLIGCALFGQPVVSQIGTPSHDSPAHHLNVKSGDMKWQRIFPELGARSAEITILRVDPTTQATQLMIRVPKKLPRAATLAYRERDAHDRERDVHHRI